MMPSEPASEAASMTPSSVAMPRMSEQGVTSKDGFHVLMPIGAMARSKMLMRNTWKQRCERQCAKNK